MVSLPGAIQTKETRVLARNLNRLLTMKRTLFLIAAFILISSGFSFQQPAKDDTNARVKAVFLYSFTKYIEWPDNYQEGNFVITVYGGSASLITELKNITSTKTLGTQKFEIKSASSIDAIGKTHILVIPQESTYKINEILARIKGKSTLLVTEKSGMAKQGSAINFVVVDNKQKFELNKSNAERYNLKVSSNLSSLAIAVE